MMNVRKVHMAVAEEIVLMSVRVRLGAGPRSAELPQRHHEKSKADSIAEQADQGGSSGDLPCRQGRSEARRHAKVHRSSRQTFDARDLDRVPGGNPAREVVVERPAQAGTRDRECGP